MEYSALALWFALPLLSLFLLDFLSKKLSRLPPGPTPLPLVGNLYLVGGHPHLSLAKLAATYGPIMTLHLGRLTSIVISSPQLAKEALQKNDQALAGRFVPDTMTAVGHHESASVWLQPDVKWRHLRALYTKFIFSNHSLEATWGLRKRKVEELLACLSNASQAGDAVNFRQLVHATVGNIVSNIEFSVDFVDINSETASDFQILARDLNDEAGKPNLSDFFPAIRLLDPQGKRRRTSGLMKRLHRIFDRLMAERRLIRKSPGSPRKNDLLDALLDQQEEDKEHGPTDLDMKRMFVELFVAGTDATSATMEWVMAELLRCPDAMERARTELKEVVDPGREVDDADLPNLPYLRAVVKETFRLHPIGPLLVPRQALADVEIAGFKIPKGAKVMVNTWSISQDEGIYEDPSRFKPERFLESKVDFRGHHFELIPFGAGRRMCPALPLADKVVHFILATLLHSFAWKLPGEMEPKDLDMRDYNGLVMEKVEPLVAVPVRENSDGLKKQRPTLVYRQ